MSKKEKILLYPREYNKRGEQNLHSVMGVASDGRLVNVKLRIDDDFARGKRAPSIAEFSRTDRKAKNPAIASPNNSAQNREGMILFTNAVHEKNDKAKGVDHYIASWGFVICEDSESPEPITGLGRMKVKKESSTVKMMKRRLSSNLSDEEKKHILSSIEDPKNFDYSLMIYHPEKQFKVDDGSIGQVKDHSGMEWFESLYKRGLSFGFYVIYCDSNGDPVPNLSREHLSAFNSITVEIESPTEFINSFTETVKQKLKKNKSAILIPCYKVNASYGAKSYYGSPEPLRMISEVYKNSEGNARVSTVLAKTVPVGSGKSVIFDRIHPLKYEKLNLDLLDKNLNESRIYSSSMSLNINHKDISSTRVGIISEEDYQNLFYASRSDKEHDSHQRDEDPVITQSADPDNISGSTEEMNMEEDLTHIQKREDKGQNLSEEDVSSDDQESYSEDFSSTASTDTARELSEQKTTGPIDKDIAPDSACHSAIEKENENQNTLSPPVEEEDSSATKLDAENKESDEVQVAEHKESSDDDSGVKSGSAQRSDKSKTSGVAAFLKNKR